MSLTRRFQKKILKDGVGVAGSGKPTIIKTIPKTLIARQQAVADFGKGIERDIETLSGIKSKASKEEAKRDTLIPKYWDTVETFIKAGLTHPLFTVIMVWLFDAKEIARAMTLAKFCVAHNIPMPAKIKRDIFTFICDALAEWGETELKEGRTLEPYLSDLFELVEGVDLHDEVTAKIYRLKGLYLVELEDWENAVDALQMALKFKAKVQTVLKAAEKKLEAQREQELLNDQEPGNKDDESQDNTQGNDDQTEPPADEKEK